MNYKMLPINGLLTQVEVKETWLLKRKLCEHCFSAAEEKALQALPTKERTATIAKLRADGKEAFSTLEDLKSYTRWNGTVNKIGLCPMHLKTLTEKTVEELGPELARAYGYEVPLPAAAAAADTSAAA